MPFQIEKGEGWDGNEVKKDSANRKDEAVYVWNAGAGGGGWRVHLSPRRIHSGPNPQHPRLHSAPLPCSATKIKKGQMFLLLVIVEENALGEKGEQEKQAPNRKD